MKVLVIIDGKNQICNCQVSNVPINIWNKGTDSIVDYLYEKYNCDILHFEKYTKKIKELFAN